jgi:NADPH:quinone reductase-like Zn-dependent oxidoreductase
MAQVPGDRRDCFATTTVTAPATAFTRAPQDFSLREAATLPCAALTVWRALFVNGGLKPGQTVLTQGTGGVSMFAFQFAKAAGAKVIVTSSSEEKLERLRALGADLVINYRRDPEWGRIAYDLSGGGVDHVVELGGNGTLPQSIVATRICGHIALIGVLSGVRDGTRLDGLMAKQIRLQGLLAGNRAEQIEMIPAIEANAIKPILDRAFTLPQLADVFRYQESGAHFGKITISLD